MDACTGVDTRLLYTVTTPASSCSGIWTPSLRAERDEGASNGVAERELAEVREHEPYGVTPATQRGPPSGE